MSKAEVAEVAVGVADAAVEVELLARSDDTETRELVERLAHQVALLADALASLT